MTTDKYIVRTETVDEWQKLLNSWKEYRIQILRDYVHVINGEVLITLFIKRTGTENQNEIGYTPHE